MDSGGKGRISDKLTKAKQLVTQPIELSEPEKKRLNEIVALMKEGLDEILAEALSKPRDEAFALVNGYLIAMQGQSESRSKPSSTSKPEKAAPVVRPKLEEIYAVLKPKDQVRAQEMLECVKNHARLKAEGQDGNQVTCSDCTPEKMIQCIRTADPTIRPDAEPVA